jgi:acyl transferase domain-containing protein
MKLVAERGRLMQSLPEGGAMATVSAAAAKVQEALRGQDDVCVGAYNGADTVISGARNEVDAVVERFQALGVRCRRLVTSHAFHSARMEPMLEDFRRFAAGVSYRAPTKHMISNVSGDIVGEDRVLDAEYWTTHIREPVQFERGMQALQAHGCDVLLEIGPHPVLVGMGQPCWTAEEEPLWVASLRREQADAEQMLGAAASMYAAGVEIDFAAMYAPWKSSRGRVDLPFYPFQRQHFWVAASQSAGKPAGARIQDCLYSVTWAQKDPGPRPAQTIQSETWLILADESGVTATLRRQVEHSGRRCVVLAAGAARVLAEEIAAADGLTAAPLTNVIHLWSLDQPRAESAAQLWEAQTRGVESAVNLVQVLINRRWRGRLWLVTSGVQRVLDSDGANPTHSPIWGLGKSIGMEHPELWGGLIDLPGDLSAAGLLTALESEDAEDQVALRDGRRWVARLESRVATSGAQPISLDAEASYLITGGLGGIGLEVANRLVQRGARHVVLNGRRAPSDSARQAIAALERLDCEVKVVLGDISQEADVAALLDEIRDSRLPPLKGIIHAAGIDALVRLHEIDREQLRRTLAPKMAGAWLLDKLAAQRGIELTLFICTSSISSVWGSVGQSAYSAANAFLDALAEHRRAHGRPATTINYGPWARVGMGTANEEGLAWLRSRGIRPLDPALALDGMEAAVVTEGAATVFADVNWTIFRELAELQRQRPLFEKLGQPKEMEAAESLRFAAALSPAHRGGACRPRRAADAGCEEELAKVLQRPVAELGNEVGFSTLDGLADGRRVSECVVAASEPQAARDGRHGSTEISRALTTLYHRGHPRALWEDPAGGSLGQTITDDTEAEVAAMSSGEVDSALDEVESGP